MIKLLYKTLLTFSILLTSNNFYGQNEVLDAIENSTNTEEIRLTVIPSWQNKYCIVLTKNNDSISIHKYQFIKGDFILIEGNDLNQRYINIINTNLIKDLPHLKKIKHKKRGCQITDGFKYNLEYKKDTKIVSHFAINPQFYSFCFPEDYYLKDFAKIIDILDGNR